ncbi:MAG: hypothetical protein DRJ69_03525, partial [Thermoprotei archaeon]
MAVEAWLREVEHYAAGKPMVRTSDGYLAPWNREAIVKQLLRETELATKFFGVPAITREEAEEIAREAEERIARMRARFVSAPLIREVVNNILLERSEERPIYAIYRNVLTRVGVPVYDAYLIDVGEGYEARENANLQPNPESIPPDELVIYDDGKGVMLAEVGKLIDEYMDRYRHRVEKRGGTEVLRLEEGLIKVACFDEDLKVKMLPATALIRHRGKRVYRVTLENGRVVRVTEDHNLFTLKQGQLTPIPLSELKLGSLIAVPRRMRRANLITKVNLVVNLLKNCSDEDLKYIYLRSAKVKEWIDSYRENIIEIALEKGLPLIKRRLSRSLLRDKVLPLWKHRRVMPLIVVKYLGVDLDALSFEDRIGTWRSKNNFALPAVVEASWDLGFIVGLLVSEGYLGKKRLAITASHTGSHQTQVYVSNSDPKVIAELKDSWLRTFGYLPSTSYRPLPRLRLGTRPLSFILEKALSIRVAGAREKELPSWLFNAPDE